MMCIIFKGVIRHITKFTYHATEVKTDCGEVEGQHPVEIELMS